MINCLNYIDNYKMMRDEDPLSMVLTDRTRVQIMGRGTRGELGDVFYVPDIRNGLLLVREMDRQIVTTTFSDGVCQMRERVAGKLVLHR